MERRRVPYYDLEVVGQAQPVREIRHNLRAGGGVPAESGRGVIGPQTTSLISDRDFSKIVCDRHQVTTDASHLGDVTSVAQLVHFLQYTHSVCEHVTLTVVPVGTGRNDRPPVQGGHKDSKCTDSTECPTAHGGIHGVLHRFHDFVSDPMTTHPVQFGRYFPHSRPRARSKPERDGIRHVGRR